MRSMADTPNRSYGCSLGCGNPYDFIVVTVQDGSTLFLCAPDFVKTGAEMLEAMTNPDSEFTQGRMAELDAVDTPPMDGPALPKRGHHAPVDTEDPDAIETFASYVLEDELPDEFRAS